MRQIVRTFNYGVLPSDLMNSEIINIVSALHEYRGKQELYLEVHADTLNALHEVARIQSTDASNKIEGIFTSDKRLNELMAQKSEPKNRKEEEIAGYRDVLGMIHESYEYIGITPNVILQLHRDMYRYTDSSFAGHWKDGNNAIVEFDDQGNQVIRFKPLSAVETPLAIENLCSIFNDAVESTTIDPLFLVPMFVFDFICIHPFNDGNGRMSRLLTLLLLYKAGYLVGKYISIEMVIEKSKETYYEVLASSSRGWETNENQYAPFVRYLLGTILSAYKEFSQRVEGLVVNKKTKAERVEDIFERRLGKITKKDILLECPDISATTVERVLAELIREGKIGKVGGGRSAGYVKLQ
ncbi:MAG: Fic family protein [Actinobacteria bacterium]|nr:Fic family protein [Actinomycetota bacterium]